MPFPNVYLGLTCAAKTEAQVQHISELGTANAGHRCTPAVQVWASCIDPQQECIENTRYRKNHTQWSYQFFSFACRFRIPTPLLCSKASSHFSDIRRSRLACSQKPGHALPNFFQCGARMANPLLMGFQVILTVRNYEWDSCWIWWIFHFPQGLIFGKQNDTFLTLRSLRGKIIWVITYGHIISLSKGQNKMH